MNWWLRGGGGSGRGDERRGGRRGKGTEEERRNGRVGERKHLARGRQEEARSASREQFFASVGKFGVSGS